MGLTANRGGGGGGEEKKGGVIEGNAFLSRRQLTNLNHKKKNISFIFEELHWGYLRNGYGRPLAVWKSKFQQSNCCQCAANRVVERIRQIASIAIGI